MAKRNLKYLSIAATNVTQPLIATTLTAAINPSSIPQTIAVVDSSLFQAMDWAVLDSSPNEERVLIIQIVDPTHVKIQSVGGTGNGNLLAHANGTFLRLAALVGNYRVETKDGNAAAVFIGTQGVLTDGTKAETKLQPVPLGQQPTAYSFSFTTEAGPNCIDIAEVWIAGTQNDQYLPSLGIV